MPINYLISYPRSGNTMCRYLIELMTRRPTNGLIGPVNPKDNLQEPLIYKDRTDYVLHKRHDFRGVTKKDFVFYIIRDPLECCIRHNQHRGIQEEQMKRYLDHWFSLLQEFDDHNNGIVLYYEEIIKIGMKESKMIYRNPQSSGPHFHKAKLGTDVTNKLHSYMKENYGELIKKYDLSHYTI